MFKIAPKRPTTSRKEATRSSSSTIKNAWTESSTVGPIPQRVETHKPPSNRSLQPTTPERSQIQKPALPLEPAFDPIRRTSPTVPEAMLVENGTLGAPTSATLNRRRRVHPIPAKPVARATITATFPVEEGVQGQKSSSSKQTPVVPSQNGHSIQEPVPQAPRINPPERISLSAGTQGQKSSLSKQTPVSPLQNGHSIQGPVQQSPRINPPERISVSAGTQGQKSSLSKQTPVSPPQNGHSIQEPVQQSLSISLPERNNLSTGTQGQNSSSSRRSPVSPPQNGHSIQGSVPQEPRIFMPAEGASTAATKRQAPVKATSPSVVQRDTMVPERVEGVANGPVVQSPTSSPEILTDATKRIIPRRMSLKGAQLPPPVLPLPIESSQLVESASDNISVLREENQRLQTALTQTQSTLAQVIKRLEDIDPLTHKQREQLRMISMRPKLLKFFNNLITGLNANALTCLILSSDRVNYSSRKGEAVEAGTAVTEAIPVLGSIIAAPVKVGQIGRLRYKTKNFAEIGENYVMDASSMEIANTQFAIEMTIRHLDHIQHMTTNGIKSFAEFISEKCILKAWKKKLLPVGHLHFLSDARAEMVNDWLKFIYVGKTPSLRVEKTGVETLQGLEFSWTAEDLLYSSEVEVNNATYGNAQRSAAKFRTRKGTADEIAALKLKVTRRLGDSSSSSSGQDTYESKSGLSQTTISERTTNRASSSNDNVVTELSPQNIGPNTPRHVRTSARFFNEFEAEMVMEKEKVKSKKQHHRRESSLHEGVQTGEAGNSPRPHSGAGHRRTGSRVISTMDAELLRTAKPEGKKGHHRKNSSIHNGEHLVTGLNSEGSKSSASGHSRSRSRLFQAAETEHLREKAIVSKRGHIRNTSYHTPTCSSLSRNRNT
jgi:hypothetical protein